MLKKINNLILRNLMNDPNKKFISKDTGNKSSLKKSLRSTCIILTKN